MGGEILLSRVPDVPALLASYENTSSPMKTVGRLIPELTYITSRLLTLRSLFAD